MNAIETQPAATQSVKRPRDDEADSGREVFSDVPLDVEHPFSSGAQSPTNSSSRLSSPARTVTDQGTATPGADSPAKSMNDHSIALQPPKKRVKLTFAEKEVQKMVREAQQREKADERAQKEADRREKEQAKARKEAEKEAERQKKAVEKEEKRLAKEAEEAEKEQKRKAKEERREAEKRQQEEEKRKKERAQPTLFAFLKTPKDAKSSTSSITQLPEINSNTSHPDTPTKAIKQDITQSEYEKLFPAFYIKEGVTLAPTSHLTRDDLTCEDIQNDIDSYLTGERRHPSTSSKPDIPFRTPGLRFISRGKKVKSVREIIFQIQASGGSSQPIDLTRDRQNNQEMSHGILLKSVPYKFLSFKEDVRPPYRGTYTKQPVAGIKALARNPTRRDLPNMNYDYDSEAEWEEDEQSEDIDGEDSEGEESDGGESLDEFLDDENDPLANAKRLVMEGDDLGTPISTGLCFENEKGISPNPELYRYQMKLTAFDGSTLPSGPIDPFSTTYWESPATSKTPMDPPRIPLTSMKSTSAGLNSQTKLPKTGKPGRPVSKVSDTTKPKKFVAPEDMAEFRKAIDGNELSKLGLIEVLNKQFSKTSKAAIKATLEAIATRSGNKEADKRWVLNDNDD